MNPLRSLPLLLVLLGAAPGCQAIFGDFEEAPTPPPRVISCNAREYRCIGATLERCKDDRSAWEVAEQCASENDCNLRTQSCAPCSPGQFQCNGAALQVCSGGTWQTQAPCASAALCDAQAGQCAPPPCVEGELRCAGAELLRCAPELDRFERVEICGSSALCNATLASAADPKTVRCARPACGEDEYFCEGAELRHCSVDRTTWDTVATCDSAGLCSASARTCVTTCSGAECNQGVYRSCNGSSYVDERTCASPVLCDPDIGCITPACTLPGELRCAADVSSVNLELCTDDLEWKLVESCGPEALCDAEARRCLPKGCTPRQGRCQGDAYQECDGDGVSFATVSVCPDGTCDPERGCGAACTAGFRCNDVHLEECVEGRWLRRDTCATPELCSSSAPASCFAPLCGSYLGSRSCLEDGSRVCAPGRNDWEFSEVCVSAPRCSAGLPAPAAMPGTGERIGFGPAGCTCVPGEVICNGNDRQRCNGDGLTSSVLETCAAGCTTDGSTAVCN